MNETNWSPTYELHAVTGDDERPSQTVTLHYRASVVQTTGEDWTDASLTLSTAATDTMVKTIPKASPVWIRVTYAGAGCRGLVTQPQQAPASVFGPRRVPSPAPGAMAHVPQAPGGGTSLFGAAPGGLFGAPQPQQQVSASSFGGQNASSSAQNIFASATAVQSQPFGSAATRSNQTDLGVIPFPEEDEEGTDGGSEEGPTKLVNQTPMALTYVVHGRSSIPSDGKNHVVTIAMLSFNTDIDYVSVPRIDPRVYLQVSLITCGVLNYAK